MNNYWYLLVLCALGCGCSLEQQPQADLVFQNATIWTGNPKQPEAEALALRGSRIVAVGEQEAIAAFVGDSTVVVDAGQRFITPGFIDCHVHFLTGGRRLSSVQLRNAENPADFARRIGDYAQTMPPGTWITGGDWDHENWGGELPDRAWVDSLTPNHPVWVNRLDGHMALANTLALDRAGVSADVSQIAGGTIGHREDGTLSGIFKDNAMVLIARRVPGQTEPQLDHALQAAMDYVAAQGVTSVHDMGGSYPERAAMERARDAGALKTRIYTTSTLPEWETLAQEVKEKGRGDEWLKRDGLKGFVDGSLGSHTAAFFEPFTDNPQDSGFFVNSEADLYEWIKGADQAELQVMVHAIGDRANHTILNIYERVGEENGPRDRRFRIEHAQHLAPEDIPRFAALKVIPSMQPYHAIDDGRWAEKVIGTDRAKTTYAFRDLLEEGARLAFGSDWFVAPPTPLEGIYAAVTRRTTDGENPDGWVPEQKITVEEALQAYTVHAAYASFEENIKGTIQPGKLADIVVLSENILEIPEEKIREVEVWRTYVGGKIVFGQGE